MVHSQWVHYVKQNVSNAKAAALHLCFPSYKEATSEVPSIATDPRGESLLYTCYVIAGSMHTEMPVGY